MGAIFAMEKDGVVYLAADTVKELCDVNFYVNNEDNFKIHKMPSGIIVAAIGAMRVTQQMWFHDEWFELEENEVFDKKFITQKIIPKFYEEIKDKDFWESGGCRCRKVKTIDASFILVKGQDIYILQKDLSVIKCDGMAAISSEDAEEIMLSYAANCKGHNPEIIIKKTYEFTADKITNISKQGVIINTKDFTFKRMEEIK